MAICSVDVILRTHNRARLLPDAVASFFAADDCGLTARLIVVDNASTDMTRAVLASLAARHGDRLLAIHEPRPGGQHALNAALAHARADVVAFFDDDERMVPGWLQAIAREFADPATDYIAGPVLPPPDSRLPDWIPKGFGGVLGYIDHGQRRRRYEPGFSAMLTQGNCALRRSVFTEFGPYPECLVTAEDRWLNRRLNETGKRGYYVPALRVTHLMPPERITPEYFRGWARREGHDLAICDALAGERWLTTRRWYWRKVVGCALRWLTARFPLSRPGTRADQLYHELFVRMALSYIRTQFTVGRAVAPG